MLAGSTRSLVGGSLWLSVLLEQAFEFFGGFAGGLDEHGLVPEHGVLALQELFMVALEALQNLAGFVGRLPQAFQHRFGELVEYRVARKMVLTPSSVSRGV